MDDLKAFESIVRTTYYIDNIYNRLYQLEVDGKKDTDEYNKMLNYLNTFLDIEKEEYQKANLYIDKCLAYMNIILMSNENLEVKKSIFEYVVDQKYEDRIKYRIINKLTVFLSSNTAMVMQELKETDFDVVNIAMQSDNANEKDILKLFVTILESFINDPKFNSNKNKLISSKYNCAFIKSSIEECMVKSGFASTDRVVSEFNKIKELNLTYAERLDFIRNVYAFEILMNQIEKMLDISDMDYSNKEKVTESILSQCALKSSLQLFGDSVGYQVSTDIKNKSAKMEDLNKISISIIMQILNASKEDRKKYIDTFNPNQK